MAWANFFGGGQGSAGGQALAQQLMVPRGGVNYPRQGIAALPAWAQAAARRRINAQLQARIAANNPGAAMGAAAGGQTPTTTVPPAWQDPVIAGQLRDIYPGRRDYSQP